MAGKKKNGADVPFAVPTWPSFVDLPFGCPPDTKPHRLKTKGSIPRERFCCHCGRRELVRSDNKSPGCQKCASSRGGKLGCKSRYSKNPPPLVQCGQCGKDIYASLRKKFCSRACASAFASIDRTCKKCAKSFRIRKSSISGRTNSSGNFCSRPCYEQWLYKGEKSKMDRGPHWAAIKREAIRRNPFCAACGTFKSLHVHHIIPYRLSKDNHQDNLIPLCRKHHKTIEAYYLKTEQDELGTPDPGMLWLRRSCLIDLQSITRTRLKQALREPYAQAG